jgi:predicted permease
MRQLDPLLLMLGHLKQDVHYALRQWQRAPGFVATAIVTLALGIGGTTAMFTLVDAVLLRPLPVAQPDQLFRVGDNAYSGVTSGLQNNFGIFSYDLYKYFRANTLEFEELAAFQAEPRRIGVRRGGSNEPAQAAVGEFVSGNYFATFGISAFSGRVMNGSDDEAGASPVAVLSYNAWQQKYAADPSVVGSAFGMNGTAVTVVGIAPRGFFGDNLRSIPPDFWISILSERSINRASALVDQPEMLWLNIMGRVQPGARPRQIESRMKVELQQWLTRHANSMTEAQRALIPRQTLHLVSGRAGVVSARSMRTAYEGGLRLLMMISGFVLLIVCANLANLVLVRALERKREASISVALGASRSRLIAQALTENVLLALAGGAGGLAVAYVATKAILRLVFAGSSDVPVDASPAPAVLMFATAVSIVTGMLFGIVPAWLGSRPDPIEALRGGRSTAASGRFPQRILVALQAALSLALLAASGLLLQSLRNVEQQRFGFDIGGRIAVRADAFLAGYKPEQLEPLFQRARDLLSRLPGVVSVSASLYGPLSGSAWQGTVYVQGQPPPQPDSTANNCPFDKVSPGYFETIGTQLVDGRGISKQDTTTSRHVAVVNQSFVRRFFARENPLGRHFGKDGLKYTADYEIVGVVEDAKYVNPEESAPPMFFLPLTQATKYDDDPSENTLEIRTRYPGEFEIQLTPGAALTEPEIRRVFAEIDPNLPVISVQSFAQQVNRTLTQQGLLARLTLLFGLTALLLVSIGTYGVTARAVETRTREIGIRMALGADRKSVLALVARDAFGLVVTGLALGVPLTLMTGRLLNSRLYGISGYDAPSIFGAALALALSAAVAIVLPARRAVSMAPMAALRRD